MHSYQFDITTPLIAQEHQEVAGVLCIFVLSAIRPEQHEQALLSISNKLKPGGHLMFRDYAFYDMTMFRHSRRLGRCLWQRENDGTLAYYFEKPYFESIAKKCNFAVVECSMCTVQVHNRKKKQSMNRVFLHALLRKDDL